MRVSKFRSIFFVSALPVSGVNAQYSIAELCARVVTFQLDDVQPCADEATAAAAGERVGHEKMFEILGEYLLTPQYAANIINIQVAKREAMRKAAQEAKASANQQPSKDNNSSAEDEESDDDSAPAEAATRRSSPRRTSTPPRGRGRGGKSGEEGRGGGQGEPATPAAAALGRGRVERGGRGGRGSGSDHPSAKQQKTGRGGTNNSGSNRPSIRSADKNQQKRGGGGLLAADGRMLDELSKRELVQHILGNNKDY